MLILHDTKVHRTDPYQHTEIWLVRYGSVTVDFVRYRPFMVDNDKKFDRYRVVSVNFARYIYVMIDSDRYIPCNSWYRPVQDGPHTGKPSDRYVPPIPGGTENLA
ncbi:hypothetical protein B296_00030805 [Ensete ventricosum]|uniref:Uncharacterized protein n=1 Tax=Ensete ventricosum TaxID=4639 RepID=A0A427A984_ENSVE|nr:hypothetical protein B296_00030805 [Ensete ventricosum]